MNALNPTNSTRSTPTSLSPAAHTQRPPQAMELAALPSHALLRGQKTVSIEHNGILYRLQSTRAGKLILTK